MKNYQTMSNDELNMMVADLHGGCVGVDYCNNPSDAWSIIMENKIAVMPWNTEEWQAFIMNDGEPALRVCDSNPFRAVMIVLLMIQEQKS